MWFVVGGLWFVGLVSAEPTIVVDPITKTITVIDDEGTTTVTESTDETTTEEEITDSGDDALTEFDRALSWMYANGLTKYNTSDAYMPFNSLTREQFAKMVRQFYVTMGYDTSTKNTACDFTDIDNADPTLVPHILETCRLGIFRGYNGLFMPFNQITRAEVLAVLLRIYNQAKLDETKNPWWLDYYTQAQGLGITDETIQANMDQSANRYTIAMYIWRLRNVILEEKNDGTSTATSVEKDDTSNLTDTSSDALVIDGDAVLLEAIHSMYEDGMIMFDAWDDSKLYKTITRADVARILDRFGQLYITDYVVKDVPLTCDFADIRDLDAATQKSIKQLCAMNVMKGDAVSGNFFPTQVLTKAQFVTTVVRMMDGVLDETTNPWWENYYQRALSWKIITSQDRASFEREMSMIEVIGFMHKLKIHAILGASTTSTELLTNEFVRVIENSDGEIKAYIDSNFLRDIDSKIGYITLDTDQRYKVTRDHIEEYTNARLAWYGTISDPITDAEKGSVRFLTQKGHVIQGTIRLTDVDQYYTIMPDENSYYWYTIIKAARD
ncbi:MAG: S-layer homology domain-containing protein [Candidatus Peribacteria bacterium]|nr:MAG: S-layer homology domain-containing protein [Candidatus Peribacteria bacterium]